MDTMLDDNLLEIYQRNMQALREQEEQAIETEVEKDRESELEAYKAAIWFTPPSTPSPSYTLTVDDSSTSGTVSGDYWGSVVDASSSSPTFTWTTGSTGMRIPHAPSLPKSKTPLLDHDKLKMKMEFLLKQMQETEYFQTKSALAETPETRIEKALKKKEGKT